MNDMQRLFAAWAPCQGIWSLWVKPVLFAQTHYPMDDKQEPISPAMKVAWAPPADGTTALVLDLPGDMSVAYGLLLARQGYAPVPLFNGCPGPMGASMVNMNNVLVMLSRLGDDLAQLSLSPDAPPAFLLDNRRMAGGKVPAPGQFDNRWIVFPQDFPSGNLLHHRGLRKVMLCTRETTSVPEDLAHVLLRFKQAELEVVVKDVASEDPPRPIEIKKPSFFGRFMYRLKAVIGMHRANVGGFGDTVPIPRQSGDSSFGGFGGYGGYGRFG